MSLIEFTPKTEICLIAEHPGASNHFKAFIAPLERSGAVVTVLAGKNVVALFDSHASIRTVPYDPAAGAESLRDLLHKVADKAALILSDVAASRWTEPLRELKMSGREFTHFVYYDNPDPYVPGGYSKTAGAVIPTADKVLFANARLQELPVYSEPGVAIRMPKGKRYGIGYYPTEGAETLKALRAEMRDELRSQLFAALNFTDKHDKIITYIGGANEEYLDKALPRFLSMVAAIANEKHHPLYRTVIVFQQHPRMRGGENLDRYYIDGLKRLGVLSDTAPIIWFSTFKTEEALALADLVLYHQSSMVPQVALSGIPAAQVADRLNPDAATDSGVPFINSVKELESLLLKLRKGGAPTLDAEGMERLKERLGTRADWQERLTRSLGLN